MYLCTGTTWKQTTDFCLFLPTRRYASVGLCDSDVSGCPSGRPSHAGIVPSTAKAGSWNVHHLIAPWLVSGKVWVVNKFARGHPQKWCQMRVGWVFSAIFDQCRHISKTVHFRHKLLWDGNKKPYAGYQMVSHSMTLSDPWPGFQGHSSFKRRVSPKRRILQTQLLYRT